MAGTRPIIYWDTCIWLAWIKNEKRDPGQIEGIEEQVAQFEKNDIVIATSVLTLTEMLDLQNKLSAAAQRKFTHFFGGSRLVRIAADIRVAELARDLRDHYFRAHLRDGLPTIELGDAIHLASALHVKASKFMTFDERDSKKPSKARRGLVNLSGDVAGHNLKIEKPMIVSPQMPLALPVAPQASSQTPTNKPSGKKASENRKIQGG